MTKLLEHAVIASRKLPPDEQSFVERAILTLAEDHTASIEIARDEELAIVRSRVAAARGEFASDAEVAAVWAKHGL